MREIIKLMFDIFVINLFITDIIVRYKYKKELKKLQEELKYDNENKTKDKKKV